VRRRLSQHHLSPPPMQEMQRSISNRNQDGSWPRQLLGPHSRHALSAKRVLALRETRNKQHQLHEADSEATWEEEENWPKAHKGGTQDVRVREVPPRDFPFQDTEGHPFDHLRRTSLTEYALISIGQAILIYFSLPRWGEWPDQPVCRGSQSCRLACRLRSTSDRVRMTPTRVSSSVLDDVAHRSRFCPRVRKVRRLCRSIGPGDSCRNLPGYHASHPAADAPESNWRSTSGSH